MVAKEPLLLVVMGVSASGKTIVGTCLAERLGLPFVDGDDLHPATNVAKMAAGHPLDDDDRWPWLAKVGETLAQAADSGAVVACSALKRSYRDAIRAVAPGTRFLLLSGSRDVLLQRIKKRKGHFMPASLLDSQLATLEPLAPDEPGVVVDVTGTVDDVVALALEALRPS